MKKMKHILDLACLIAAAVYFFSAIYYEFTKNYVPMERCLLRAIVTMLIVKIDQD